MEYRMCPDAGYDAGKLLRHPLAADIHITPDGRHLYACDRTAV